VPADYLAAQGSQAGRADEVRVHDDGTDIWIGGRIETVISGAVRL
jgi:predicted PhzF superfamily epimerase YddE/YHI9